MFYLGLFTIICYIYTIISILYKIYVELWYYIKIERGACVNDK